MKRDFLSTLMLPISYTKPSQWWWSIWRNAISRNIHLCTFESATISMRPPSFWRQMSPEAMLHQLRPQSPVSIWPHQSHGRKCLKRRRIFPLALLIFRKGTSKQRFTWFHAPIRHSQRWTPEHADRSEARIHSCHRELFFLHNLRIKDSLYGQHKNQVQ